MPPNKIELAKMINSVVSKDVFILRNDESTLVANTSFNASCRNLTLNTTEVTLPGHQISIMSLLVIALLLLPTFFYYIFCILSDFERTSQKTDSLCSRVEKKNALFANSLDESVQENEIFYNEVTHPDHNIMNYSIILRVGCPSLHFDMQNGWIEFVLVDRNNNDVHANNPFR